MANKRIWTMVAVLALLLAACGPAATATPTPVATPTATPVMGVAPAATATPTPPRPTPSPTAAPVGPKIGGTARHPQYGEAPTWDPSRHHADPLSTTKYLVFSKLFTNWSDNPQNCQGQVYPWAVQSWRWVDDTTTEFTLRQGMRFHNKPPVSGREAVAQDFVSAFERYKKNLSFMAGKAAAVELVSVKDKYTFQMKLKSPWGGMVSELLAHFYGPWLEAAEAGGPEGKLWEQPEKSWIGSGAFMFASWTPGVKWRLVRNPDYWVRGRPYLEAVEYLAMPEASTQLAALRAGQLNLIRDFNEEFIDVAARSIPGLQVVRCPGGTMTGSAMLWMNNTGPPFDDVRVRRAVAMAIDREPIVKTLYKGRATTGPVLPPAAQYAMALADFPAEVRPFLEYNPTRAKQLLAEAGYTKGPDTLINVTAAWAAPASMVAEAVAGMLNAVGIRATLNWIEYAKMLATVHRAEYPVGEMALTPRTASTPEDAHALTSFWSGGGAGNRSIVRDPEYDRLFERFRSTFDEKLRAELARQLQVMAASKTYAVPLPLGDSTMIALSGLHFTWVGNTRDYGPLLETLRMD